MVDGMFSFIILHCSVSLGLAIMKLFMSILLFDICEVLRHNLQCIFDFCLPCKEIESHVWHLDYTDQIGKFCNTCVLR